jgi:hypothetical protein
MLLGAMLLRVFYPQITFVLVDHISIKPFISRSPCRAKEEKKKLLQHSLLGKGAEFTLYLSTAQPSLELQLLAKGSFAELQTTEYKTDNKHT